MRAFIACSEADEAVAQELQEFLKPYGLIAEVETGARGFRHLQASDVVVALWSRNSVFGTHRMQLEKRMLDAWAEEKLILVKLDHHFLPVGLRDLPALDGTFETARKSTVWPAVSRQAKERINELLVRRQTPIEETSSSADFAAPPPPQSSPPAGAPADIFKSDTSFGAGAPDAARPRADAAKSKGGGWIWLILLALIVIGVAAVFLVQPLARNLPGPDDPSVDLGLPFGLSPTMLATVAGGALLGLICIVMVARAMSRPRRTPHKRRASVSRGELSKRSQREEMAESASVELDAFDIGELVAEAPEQKLIFISYAHADDEDVTPVVTVIKSSGRGVWIDKGGIQAGTGWAGEIVRAIKSAGGVMVMCSSSAFQSDHVKREIYLADRYRKPMLPVFLEDAQPPEDFEFFFAGVQWLQLFKLPEEERAGAVQRALAAVS